MNLKHDRIHAPREQMRLPAIAAQWQTPPPPEMDARTEHTRQTQQKL